MKLPLSTLTVCHCIAQTLCHNHLQDRLKMFHQAATHLFGEATRVGIKWFEPEKCVCCHWNFNKLRFSNLELMFRHMVVLQAFGIADLWVIKWVSTNQVHSKKWHRFAFNVQLLRDTAGCGGLTRSMWCSTHCTEGTHTKTIPLDGSSVKSYLFSCIPPHQWRWRVKT